MWQAAANCYNTWILPVSAWDFQLQVWGWCLNLFYLNSDIFDNNGFLYCVLDIGKQWNWLGCGFQLGECRVIDKCTFASPIRCPWITLSISCKLNHFNTILLFQHYTWSVWVFVESLQWQTCKDHSLKFKQNFSVIERYLKFLIKQLIDTEMYATAEYTRTHLTVFVQFMVCVCR